MSVHIRPHLRWQFLEVERLFSKMHQDNTSGLQDWIFCLSFSKLRLDKVATCWWTSKCVFLGKLLLCVSTMSEQLIRAWHLFTTLDQLELLNLANLFGPCEHKQPKRKMQDMNCFVPWTRMKQTSHRSGYTQRLYAVVKLFVVVTFTRRSFTGIYLENKDCPLSYLVYVQCCHVGLLVPVSSARIHLGHVARWP